MDQHIINNLEVDEITGNYFKDTPNGRLYSNRLI